MSKTEYAWVIQRDDGMYVNFMDNDDLTMWEETDIDNFYKELFANE